MIKLIKVTGNSLSPSFLDGDYVLIGTRKRKLASYKIGDILVADHQLLGLIIKRVRANHPDTQTFELEGTNPASISSQKIGLVPYQAVLGEVLLHIKRPR